VSNFDKWSTNVSADSDQGDKPGSPEAPGGLRLVKFRGVTDVTIVDDSSSLLPLFGTKDVDFLFGLVHQLCNAGEKGDLPDDRGIKFMLAFVKARHPRDEIEAALLAQMAAIHIACMRFAHRLAEAEGVQEQDSAERALNKLMRTFTSQTEAFQRYRSVHPPNVMMQDASVGDDGCRVVQEISPPRRKREMKRPRIPADARDAQQSRQTVGAERSARRLSK
jgi:hypothetical protein